MSVIILIDGSPEASAASYFAISVARALGTDIIAQSVIDSDAIVELTGYKGFPGLCGSGVFIGAYEQIVKTLEEVADSLMMSLAARAEGSGVKVASYTDTGSFDGIMLNRIAQYDAIVILPDSEKNRLLAASMGDDRPIVFVNTDRSGKPTGLSIVANDDWMERLYAELQKAFPDAAFTVRRPEQKRVAA